MKKISILGLCFITAASVCAQKNVVKEAERASSIKDARAIIAPALTNPETKDDAYTWYVAGKKEFGYYDDLYAKMAIGSKDINGQDMGMALINGYEYYMTALPLDSVAEVDKNGTPKLNKDGSVKIKTKYSKDIVNTIGGHFNDFLNAGQLLYDAKDYANAAKAWGIYTQLPYDERLGKAKPDAPADSTMGQILYYQGVAAWQGENLPAALEAFERAIALSYKEKSLYDYAMSVAAQQKDEAKVVNIAKRANELFGHEDSKYISIVINDLIIKENYSEAMSLLETAIANNPNNAQLHNVMGVLYESQKQNDTAYEYYQKAVELDPANAKHQYDFGRIIYIKAATISEGAANLGQAEYNKVHAEQVTPLLKEALPYLEKAYSLDEGNKDYKQLLRRLYYDLNMGTELEQLERGY